MNLGLLNLQERGTLREMQHTWWKEKHGGGACKVPRVTARVASVCLARFTCEAPPDNMRHFDADIVHRRSIE